MSFINNENVNISLGNSVVSVSKTDLVEIVDSSIVYPKSKSIEDKVKGASLVVSYKCIEKKCGFTKAIQDIMNSGELKALGVKELSKEVIVSVEQNPELFPSCDLGGYLVQTTGIPFLFVRNDTPKPDRAPGDVRYGFTDLTEVRKILLFEAIRRKEHNRKVEDMLVGAGALATAVGFFGGITWVAKKLR